MLKLTSVSLLLMAAGIVSVPAQVIHIEPAQFVQQYEDSVYSGMTYMGHGLFWRDRSCRMDWFDVKFTVIKFDCSTKVLTIEGQVMNSNWDRGPIRASQTLIGVPNNAYDQPGGPMTVRVNIANDSLGCFRHTLGPVQPGDRIAFTTPEPAVDYGCGPCAWSKVYNVGRLADCPVDSDDGATLGQR